MEAALAYVRGYARTTSRFWLALLWCYCSLLAIELVRFQLTEAVSFWLIPMSMLNFGIHETAHAFTMGLPTIITAASGSLSEILFGLLLLAVAIKTESLAFVCYALLWLAFGFIDAGIYMADAIPQRLQLFSPFGDNAVHDWRYVFEATGMLPISGGVGKTLIGCGYVVALGAALGSGYIMVESFRQHKLMKAAHTVALAGSGSQAHISHASLTSSKVAGSNKAAASYPVAYRGTLADRLPQDQIQTEVQHDHRH